MNGSTNLLPGVIRRFLGDYLPHQLALSEHTILSYRDSIKLLLQFTAGAKHKVSAITIDELSPTLIVSFLAHLEAHRRNQPATRNVRLTAIHSFFAYLGRNHPEYLDQANRVLSIPFKRTDERIVDYLEAGEMKILLDSIDRSTQAGRRDYTLLTLMFNTGARVQEVVSLRTGDLRLISPPSVKFFGKGRKERICPLWPETARLLKQYCDDQAIDLREPQPLFRNHRGGQLTRFGARLILQRHAHRAIKTCPALSRKRIHPHSVRHSTAVHLLNAGVDLSTIAHWLGHKSINTTHKYIAIDLEAKRAAIAKAGPIIGNVRAPSSWHASEDILKWLESL
jgi:site-specific recombinase XerD